MTSCPCCERDLPKGLMIWARPGQREIWVDGYWIKTKPIEADIMYVLLQAKGKVVTRGELTDQVYGPNPPQPNTVNVHVCNLRRAIRHRTNLDIIKTHYAYGFSLEGLSISPVYKG